MIDIISRPFISADRLACLSIFDSNAPPFFAPEEHVEFCEHLENLDDIETPYIVLVRGDVVVACGGLTVDMTCQKALLVWGMVERELHGIGLGSILTQARLTLARAKPDLTKIKLSTSQHTNGFYERFGFALSKITPNGFGPGLDRLDMTLEL